MSVEVTTLANGMRVVTDAMPHLETASLGVWVGAGARNERPAENGISHLLEHMAFKGTKRRTAQGIAEEIEAVGGHLNAWTSREQTAYFARVLKDDVALGIDLLADILLHSTFDPVELARERDVVIQEIGEADDNPDDVVFDRLQAVAYPDQPLGRPILGTRETVLSFERDSLRAYLARHYHGPRLVLAAAGKVEHGAILRLAEDLFGGIGNAAGPASEGGRYQGGEQREARDLEQLHLAMAFPGLAFEDPDYYAFQVLSTVLGGGMSSRLFQEAREKRGLCYSVYSFNASYADGGLLGIYAGTGADRVQELISVIAGETIALAAKAGAEEVARARAQLKAGLMMALESSSARCDQLGRQLLIYGRVVPTEETLAKVAVVDAQAVERVGRRILAAGPPAFAALGPLGGLEPYDAFAARFR
ncbi:MAG: insulinase family protein [Alphaproteobacteria bacterium]|nr:insulinase family protein [Alphaproteobacteria bacterium]